MFETLFRAKNFKGDNNMSKIKLATAVCSLFLAFAAIDASADTDYQTSANQANEQLQWNPNAGGFDNGRGGPGRGHGDYDRRRPRPPGGGGYRPQWQYAGQISAPIHGAPGNWHNIDYCGTEYPRECWRRGDRCYVNNGYWWDNRNQCNWFNYYECR